MMLIVPANSLMANDEFRVAFLKLLFSFEGLDSIAENEVQIIGSQEIKVEESTSDPPLAASCQNRQSAIVQPQHHRDIRTVLVKEESTLVLNEVQVSQGSGHIRWNVEPVNMENTSCPCKYWCNSIYILRQCINILGNICCFVKINVTSEDCNLSIYFFNYKGPYTKIAT